MLITCKAIEAFTLESHHPNLSELISLKANLYALRWLKKPQKYFINRRSRRSCVCALHLPSNSGRKSFKEGQRARSFNMNAVTSFLVRMD